MLARTSCPDWKTFLTFSQTRENAHNIGQFVANFKCRSVLNVIEAKAHDCNNAHMLITLPEIVTSMNLSKCGVNAAGSVQLSKYEHILVYFPVLLRVVKLSFGFLSPDTKELKLFAIEQVDQIFLNLFDKLVHEFVNVLPAKCQFVLSCSQYNPKSVQLINRRLIEVNMTHESLLLNGTRPTFASVTYA